MPAAPGGYDPAFLGVDVAVPVPTSGRETALLDYPHFSVLLDLERRFAAMTAVNIDGAALREVPRTGRWRLDRRVDRGAQAGNAIYVDNDLDRGHLVRRRDPGWGTPNVARAATEATFVYPNAAPQAAVFNQSKDLWLGLEDHVLAHAGAQRLRVSVFTAPVLADDDPPYRGIRVPLRFFKAVAWLDGRGELAATGFVLDQSELVDTSEGARLVRSLGAYRTFQVPLAEIEALARVDLGPLTGADVGRAPAAREPTWRSLRSADDIRLTPDT